ncbi:MAG: S1 RNA-binding domain-containing protein [Oscillospiraceae bacterium]|jgi:S1 RNA binding domain protein|nr:S1 RNA-binding domain-containing protein [Oscillospiraceae bacterium]
MQLEIGSIIDGKVTGITNFGAFVELSGGETGMVHISEVAVRFVNHIKDFLSEGQEVKVKVIGILENGKISLSIKQVEEKNNDTRHPVKFEHNSKNLNYQRNPRRTNDGTWQNSAKKRFGRKQDSGPISFEDMLSKFKQTSEEKISDLKKVTASKYGGSKRGKRR